MAEPPAGGSQGVNWHDVPVVNWFLSEPEPSDGVALEELPGVDWSGWSLRDKIAWTSQGSGAQAIDSTHGALGDLGGRFRDSDGTVHRQLDGMQVGWQGQAAGSATQALTQVAAAGGASGDTSARGAVPVGTYGHSFDGLKNKFSYHEGPLTGALGDWAPAARGAAMTVPALAGSGVVDEMAKIAMNVSEGKRADHLLQAHESAARVAVTAFPSSTPGPGLPGGHGPAAPGGNGPGGVGESAGGIGTAGDGGPGASGGGGSGASTGAPAAPAPTGPDGGATGPAAPPAVGGAGATGSGTGPDAGGSDSNGGGPGGSGRDGGSGDAHATGPGPDGTTSAPSASDTNGPRTESPSALAPADVTGPSTGSPNVTSPSAPPASAPAPSAPTAGAVPSAGYLPGAVPPAGSNSGVGIGRTPGFPLPRSGSDFGSNLLRNQPGRVPGTGGAYGGGTWGEPTPRGGGSGGSGPGGSGPGGSGRYGGGGVSDGAPGRGTPEGAPGRGLTEPAGGSRSGANGVTPMGGMGAGGRGSEQDHRNRYLLPSSEAFDLDLQATPPVLGALSDEDHER